jgi:hypothetical protein
MKTQVNSDKNIVIDSGIASFVKAEVEGKLARFRDKLTRVELHLSDINAGKSGARDKRCLVEARPAGHEPLTVTMLAATVEGAVRGALSKSRRALETFFGRSTGGRAAVAPSEVAPSAGPRVGGRNKERPAPATKKSTTAGTSTKGEKPRKTAASKKVATAKTATKQAVRGPKKKKIYRARREAWPKR